jgi:hypothetical protein
MLVLGAGCRRAPPSGATRPENAAPAPAPPSEAAPPALAAAATVAPPDEDLVGEAPESNPTSEMVTIKLVAEPSRKARVSWGRKDLGFAPLEIQRPRGSGPLDLVVAAPGALTLHTRVYTDRDDKLALRLYPESDAPNLLGYRAPAEAPAQNATKVPPKVTPKKGGPAPAAKRKSSP